MQVYDDRTTGMHWQTHKQGAEHYRRLHASAGHKRMEVAVAIGADPATMYSAILPLPPDLDEMMIAGFLRGKPVEMVQVRDVRSRSAGECRDRARRLRRAGRAAHARGRSAITPAFYSLDGRLPGVPCDVRHASQESDLCDDDRRVRRPWRTSTWARPSSAFSCR